MTPVRLTFAAWLEGRNGKLIREYWHKKANAWTVPDVPELASRDVYSFKSAFENCLNTAGEAHPSLGLGRPLIGPDGRRLHRLVNVRAGSRFRQVEMPRWEDIGNRNTFRHTIHTQLQRVGVSQAQIDAASGHAEQGTGRRYTHWNAKADLVVLTK